MAVSSWQLANRQQTWLLSVHFLFGQLTNTAVLIVGATSFVVEVVHPLLRRENKARGGGICVANHTSPIDVVILGCDNTYAMVSCCCGEQCPRFC